jgi:S-DNA-T family DNA segregation ATPase FtsK/SpoIIIE
MKSVASVCRPPVIFGVAKGSSTFERNPQETTNLVTKKAPIKKRPAAPEKAAAKRGASRFRLAMEAFRRAWANPKTRSAAGVVVLFSGVYVFGALVSGLFTGAADYLAVSESADMDRTGYRNWLGGAGAHIAFELSREGLGLGAMALPVWLFLLGWRWLTGKPVAKQGLIFRFSLLGLIVLPWCVGFIAHLGGWIGAPAWDHWVGASGHVLLELGLLHLGAFGSALVLLAITGAVSAYYLQPFLNQISLPSLPSVRDWFKADDDVDDFDARPTNRPAPTIPTPASTDEDEQEEAWAWHLDDEADRVLDEVLREPELEPELEPEPEPEQNPQQVEEEQEDLSDVGFEVHLADEEEQLTEAEINRKIKEFGEYDPKLELSRFQFPTLDLLLNHGDGKHRVSKDELEANKERIEATLANFKIDITKITAEVGPTVTLYEIVPAPGVRISKIKNLEDDIALSLSALGIRIIAPIPGRGTIGIEVPNSNPDVVSMKALIASEKFQNSDGALPVAIGKTISNETYVFDLAKMPHLLMAGATGQGKSVGLNAILVSLLYRKHPTQLKFVLVDPKKVELTLFNHIERHYLAKLPDAGEAIITDTSKVVATLNSCALKWTSVTTCSRTRNAGT